MRLRGGRVVGEESASAESASAESASAESASAESASGSKAEEVDSAVYYASVDMDGCLFNGKFYGLLAYNKFHNGYVDAPDGLARYGEYLIAANENLIAYLQQQLKKKSRIIIGSNRQSIATDLRNARQPMRGKLTGETVVFTSGSCVTAIQIFHQHLQGLQLDVDLEKFVMADLYNNLKDGEGLFDNTALKLNEVPVSGEELVISELATLDPDKNIAEALGAQNRGFELFPFNTVFDLSKFTLLYVQIHRAANQHPEEVIRFEFFDDSIDILNGLNRFFSAHPELLPKNVELILTRYTGEFNTEFTPCTIKGSGIIDTAYRETTKSMATFAWGLEGESLVTQDNLHKARQFPSLASRSDRELGLLAEHIKSKQVSSAERGADATALANYYAQWGVGSLFDIAGFGAGAGAAAAPGPDAGSLGGDSGAAGAASPYASDPPTPVI